MIFAAVNALGIFSTGELNGSGRSWEEHGIAAGAIFVLDDDRLATDHVGRTMQQERSRDSTSQPTVDRLVLVIERIDHHHLRRDRTGGLVHVIVKRDMRMGVDNSWREIFTAGINDRRSRRGFQISSHCCDLAVFDVDAAILNVSMCDGHHDGIINKNFIMSCGLRHSRSRLARRRGNYRYTHQRRTYCDAIH